MAKADEPTSTDWIWLRDARDLAAVAFGSKPLALKRLCEWMAAGKLPWIAEEWQGLDAAGIEKQDRDLRVWGVVAALSARTVYYNGDPRFWDADLTDLEINVEHNTACEAHGRMNGARAEGIKVSRTHLQKLLPAGGVNLASAADADGASTQTWIRAEVKRMKVAGEIRPGIKITYFARDLKRRMDKAVHAGTAKKSVTWRYIKDSLPHWGLWPISSIN